MSHLVRPATEADLDSLVEIEELAFDSDRTSRRSFRAFATRPTALLSVCEVEGRIAGYYLVLFRKNSALARLYSIALHPQFLGQGLGAYLLDAAERAAFDRGSIALRLEVREDNAGAIALYRKHGYREWGRHDDYYEDHADALRFEKMLRGETDLHSTVPYYRQTEEFTCGAACLMMAQAYFTGKPPLGEVEEFRIWREATTIYMQAGTGGCGPYGLAVAAAARGLHPALLVSQSGALFLDTVRSPEKRRVMELAQQDLREQAECSGTPIEYRPFELGDLQATLAQGGLAIVLISAFQMLGVKVPHWVLVIGDTGSHLVLHDPYADPERGENRVDASHLPLSYDTFLKMARYGKSGLRACVLLQPTPRS